MSRKSNTFNPHGTARAESLAGVQLASFRRRAIAFTIDSFLVSSSSAILFEGFKFLFDHWIHLLRNFLNLHELYEAVHHPASIVWMVLYYGLMVWKTNGHTLGKRWMKIRVLSLTHERITLWQAIERTLGYGASFLEGGFGFFQYYLHPNRCCVHDRIAETIVVRDLPEVAAFIQPAQQRAALEPPVEECAEETVQA